MIAKGVSIMIRDGGLDILLSLHGEVFVDNTGYWQKIEAWRVPVTAGIPHGLRYSLTLHDRTNKRVMGYDNAHAIPPARKKYSAARYVEWDHMHTHPSDKGTHYEFISATQLLEDFFRDVNRYLECVR
jgi:hypothetical protein